MLKLGILSLVLGFTSHWCAIWFGINARTIPYLEEIMNTTIALSLYINVLSIDRTLFKSNLGLILKVLVLGVPIKIVLPGLILTLLSPTVAPVAYLCATVIAQIDPIASAKSFENNNISKKSETILRAWTSFDDPVSILFGFYIFLPLIVSNNFSFSQYFVRIAGDIVGCFIVYYLSKWLNTIHSDIKSKLEIIFILLIIVYSVLWDSFILSAFAGLFLRPIVSEKLEIIITPIFYFSVIVIGLLSINLSFDWLSGGILAFSTFVLGQVIVTILFFKESIANKLRVMFGHQNGMTSILLTVAIEVSGSEKTRDLLSITLPAILLIALFYFSTNYVLDRTLPPPQT